MSVFKSYAFLQSLGGIAQKLSPPRLSRQPHFLSHILQILVKHVSFTSKQMMLMFYFNIFDRILTIFKKLVFFLWEWTHMVGILTHDPEKENQFFEIVRILPKILKWDINIICLPIKDTCLTKIWRMSLKKSCRSSKLKWVWRQRSMQ